MLTGAALLRKVRELGDVSKSELVRGCGYTSKKKDGGERLDFQAFYQALIEAKANSAAATPGKQRAFSGEEKSTPKQAGPTGKEKDRHRMSRLRELAQRKIRQGKALSVEELNALPGFQRRALQHSPIVVESRRDRQRRLRAESEQKPANNKATPFNRDGLDFDGAEKLHRQKLLGDELVKICLYLDGLKMGEHRIAVRAGYTVDDLGAFRRAFARSGGTDLAPLGRMLTEYKRQSSLAQADSPSHATGLGQSLDREGSRTPVDHPANKNTSREQQGRVSSTVSREYISGHSRRIKRSNGFRTAVLNSHGFQCAVCGLGIESLLEAAHIRPAAEMGSDHWSNGIPLRPNHHAAFDQHMFSIDPGTQDIEFAKGYSAELLSINRPCINLELNRESVEYRYLLFLRANE